MSIIEFVANLVITGLLVVFGLGSVFLVSDKKEV